MSKFTKGEWRLNHYHFPHQYIVAHGGEDDNDAFPGRRKICDIWDWNTEKGKANAELIASAPDLKQQRDDLLGICKEFMEKADNGSADFDDPEPGSIYLRAEAAIAKCKI